MKVYQDIISGDELCSDSYPCKVVDDIAYEFEAKTIKISNKIDDSLIGGNAASPEGGDGEPSEDAGVDDNEESVINIVHAHKLQKIPMSKQDFMTWAKQYFKELLSRLEKSSPERVDLFKAKSAKFLKEQILAKFDQWDIYTGESMNGDAGLMLMNFRDDGITPYFCLFKDGIREVKY